MYLANMRFLFPLLCILLTVGCATRSANNNHARDAILELPQSALEKEDVEIAKVSGVGGTEAIVETQLKTAFRIEKVRGKWIVREVRLGHGQWEKVDNFIRTLEEVKAAETREMLGRIGKLVAGVQLSAPFGRYQMALDVAEALGPR